MNHLQLNRSAVRSWGGAPQGPLFFTHREIWWVGGGLELDARLRVGIGGEESAQGWEKLPVE